MLSHHVLDEAKRPLHDAMCVLSQTVNDSRVLFRGGWAEMVMAKAVDELARATPGKWSYAIDAFSRALVAIPTTIADNDDLDMSWLHSFEQSTTRRVAELGLMSSLDWSCSECGRVLTFENFSIEGQRLLKTLQGRIASDFWTWIASDLLALVVVVVKEDGDVEAFVRKPSLYLVKLPSWHPSSTRRGSSSSALVVVVQKPLFTKRSTSANDLRIFRSRSQTDNHSHHLVMNKVRHRQPTT
ncbi:T-complex protein 1 subunit beta [Linum perenne]